MLIFFILLLSLIPLSAPAVHPCNANVKVDGAALDSHCLKVGVNRTARHTTFTANRAGVVENLTFSGVTGPCINITVANVTVKNNDITGCSGNGITVGSNVNGAIIQNNYIHGIPVNAIDLSPNATNVTIYQNHITSSRTGISVQKGSTGVLVHHNRFDDLNPKLINLRGQAIQFNNMNGRGTFKCNVVSLMTPNPDPAKRATDDAINIYSSNTTLANPILIRGNLMRLGKVVHDSLILMSDDSSTASDPNIGARGGVSVEKNIIYADWDQGGPWGGMSAAGGHDFRIVDNKICGRTWPRDAGGTPHISTIKDPRSTHIESEPCRNVRYTGNEWFLQQISNGAGGIFSIEDTCKTGHVKSGNIEQSAALNTKAKCEALWTTGVSLASECNACADGIDNDGDRRRDHSSVNPNPSTADAGCTSARSQNENPAVCCSGGEVPK